LGLNENSIGGGTIFTDGAVTGVGGGLLTCGGGITGEVGVTLTGDGLVVEGVDEGGGGEVVVVVGVIGREILEEVAGSFGFFPKRLPPNISETASRV